MSIFHTNNRFCGSITTHIKIYQMLVVCQSESHPAAGEDPVPSLSHLLHLSGRNVPCMACCCYCLLVHFCSLIKMKWYESMSMTACGLWWAYVTVQSSPPLLPDVLITAVNMIILNRTHITMTLVLFCSLKRKSRPWWLGFRLPYRWSWCFPVHLCLHKFYHQGVCECSPSGKEMTNTMYGKKWNEDLFKPQIWWLVIQTWEVPGC